MFTPFEFGALAGALIGLGLARLFRPDATGGRLTSSAGLLFAAAGTALMSPAIGSPFGLWAYERTGLLAAAPVLGQLLFVAAAALASVTVLGLLRPGRPAWRAAVGLAVVVACAVMIWRWLVTVAHPVVPTAGAAAPDTRWFFVALFAGLAVTALIALAALIRTPVTVSDGDAAYFIPLALGLCAAVAWPSLRAVSAASSGSFAVPAPASWALIVTAVLGIPTGCQFLRSSMRAAAVEDVEFAAPEDVELAAPNAAAGTAAGDLDEDLDKAAEEQQDEPGAAVPAEASRGEAA